MVTGDGVAFRKVAVQLNNSVSFARFCCHDATLLTLTTSSGSCTAPWRASTSAEWTTSSRTSKRGPSSQS
jgi:hypothetical protein